LKTRFGECSAILKKMRESGLLLLEEREVYRNPFGSSVVAADSPKPLNHHQQKALDQLVARLDSGEFSPFLLHGVTGSGKTEVYLQAIAHCLLSNNSTALVLVPEISLTPQLVQRFRARFGDVIAVLHSALSDGERYDEWRRIRRGEVRIVIGARSAIFAPLQRIGIIVVDEEHEASFKQSDGLHYNARDLALVLARQENAVVVLGSATPLVTTIFAARSGRLGYLELPERIGRRPLPETISLTVRMTAETPLAPQLLEELEKNLERGEQSLVFSTGAVLPVFWSVLPAERTFAVPTVLFRLPTTVCAAAVSAITVTIRCLFPVSALTVESRSCGRWGLAQSGWNRSCSPVSNGTDRQDG